MLESLSPQNVFMGPITPPVQNSKHVYLRDKKEMIVGKNNSKLLSPINAGKGILGIVMPMRPGKK